VSQDHIELVLKGTRTTQGAVDFDALLAFGDSFRKALRALVRSRSGLPVVQPGQPGAEVKEATSLRLVGLRAGSAVLELEPLDPRIVADPVVEALRDLVDGVEGRLPLEAPVVGFLRDAVRSLGDRGSVGFRVPGRAHAEVDEARLDALPVATAATIPPDAPAVVDGWLHAVDIDPDEVRVRDTSGRDWACHYPVDLEGHVRGLIGRVVRVEGIVRFAGARGRIEVTQIDALEPPAGASIGGARTPDDVVIEAMSRSNVTGPQPLASLTTEVDADSEEELRFEAALRAMR